eukprot:Awhi_evm1s1184
MCVNFKTILNKNNRPSQDQGIPFDTYKNNNYCPNPIDFAIYKTLNKEQMMLFFYVVLSVFLRQLKKLNPDFDEKPYESILKHRIFYIGGEAGS